MLNTSQCTATVLNLSSTLVNWSVALQSGGSGDPGTIDKQSGLYKAPATVPTNTVVVTATSQVQSSVTATQPLTIEGATQISAVTCVPNPTPPSPLAVASNGQLDCTATASTGASVAVNWTVTNAASGLAVGVGSISSLGVYTAPLVPPPGGKVTITATSQAVSTISMSVTATVVFGPAVLNGNYVFSTSGRLPNGDFWARTGSFSAGNGSLNGISEDTNQSGTPNIVKTNRTFTGDYSIGADGRGTMEFCEDTGSSCSAGAATAFFRIVVVSPQQFELVEFSSPGGTTANTIAGGEMILQDSSVAGSGNQNLSGVYSFGFSGVSSNNGAVQSVAGQFCSNDFGTIGPDCTAPAAPPQQNELDVDAGGAAPLSDTPYSISSNGRGTVVLNKLTFSFYPISVSRAKFIQIDSASSILLGDSYKQQTSPTCSWTSSTALAGPTVLETLDATPGSTVADVGAFTASNTVISNVSIDQNSAGTYSQISGNGSYAMDGDGCGRGKLSVPGHSYVFYIISQSSAVLQETTSGTSAHGLLSPAQSGSLADGSYAFRMQGADAAGKEEDLLGQFASATANSATAWNGTVDVNDFGATQTGLAITNGAYKAPTPAGIRSTAMMPIGTSPATTRNLVLYMVSPTLFYVLDTDATGAALGAISNQF